MRMSGDSSVRLTKVQFLRKMRAPLYNLPFGYYRRSMCPTAVGSISISLIAFGISDRR